MKEVKAFAHHIAPRSTLRTGTTNACRSCGKREFFEGGLLHSLLAAEQSPNWCTDAVTGFLYCMECVNRLSPFTPKDD